MIETLFAKFAKVFTAIVLLYGILYIFSIYQATRPEVIFQLGGYSIRLLIASKLYRASFENWDMWQAGVRNSA